MPAAISAQPALTTVLGLASHWPQPAGSQSCTFIRNHNTWFALPQIMSTPGFTIADTKSWKRHFQPTPEKPVRP
eukprot:10273051-Heterocapsa_arctica.AAC.1